jgi:hypothetical protein
MTPNRRENPSRAHLETVVSLRLHCFLLLIFWFLLLPTVLPAQELLRVPGAFHVHTDRSTGKDSLENLIRLAKSYGIEAVILTDNYLLKFDYGLLPFRYLLRKKVEMPSILQTGPKRYLSAIDQARKRHPDLIIIPGAEVLTHYYWTGSLFQKDLTMHNGQKNILAVGLEQPKDYFELPVIGNRHAAHPHRWRSMVFLFPGLLLIPGIWLFRLRRKMTFKGRHFAVTQTKTYKWQGSALILLGLLFLLNSYFYSQSPYLPYQTHLGIRPYQQLIDHVDDQGGLTFWSMPEARDYHLIDYGRLGQLTVMTNPYPEDLINSREYTGFGAIYHDTTTFTDPGGDWDRLLNDYLMEIRSRPSWGIGEIAYHGKGLGKELVEAETVFLVPRKTKEAVLSAMREGRMYALRRTEEYGLVLEDFSVFEETTQKTAFSGGELKTTEKGPVEVRIAVSTTDGHSRPVRIRLIRSGKVFKTLEGTTPFRESLRDDTFPNQVYYRLDIGEGSHRILSNPIFVKVHEAKQGKPVI